MYRSSASCTPLASSPRHARGRFAASDGGHTPQPPSHSRILESPNRVPVPSTRPSQVRPLAPERYKLRCTISRETYCKLREAQDLLRHRIPEGDVATIVDRALTLLRPQPVRSALVVGGDGRRSLQQGNLKLAELRLSAKMRAPEVANRETRFHEDVACALPCRDSVRTEFVWVSSSSERNANEIASFR
jgi:hypothetical protein